MLQGSEAFSRPKALIFDWDNTLVDTWPVLFGAVNQTLVAMGHDAWEEPEARRRIARSLRDAFPELFGERWEEARDIFYAAFEADHLARLQLMPGADMLIAWLARSGIPAGVVSNKQGPLLRKEAAHLGWDTHFTRLVGAGDAERDKPDAAPVIMALDGTGIAAGPDVWFIGDNAIDAECAIAAGCRPVILGKTTEPVFTSVDAHAMDSLLRLESCQKLLEVFSAKD